MKNYFLLSSYYKIVGWIIFPVFVVLGISEYDIPYLQFSFLPHASPFSNTGNNLTNELALIGAVIGLLMICFARHKNEDEYITQLRLNAWQWSVFINYIILILLNFTTYGIIFCSVLVYHAFTILILFVIIFNYSLYRPGRWTLLLSKKYKQIGWILSLIFIPLGLLILNYDFSIPGFYFFSLKDDGNELLGVDSYNMTNELALTGVVIGLLMICFAKHKNEDEYITQLRLNCWQRSVLMSYVVFIIITLTCYSSLYYYALLYNMFTVLVVFIIRFYYSIYKLNKIQKLESK